MTPAALLRYEAALLRASSLSERTGCWDTAHAQQQHADLEAAATRCDALEQIASAARVLILAAEHGVADVAHLEALGAALDTLPP